MILRLFFALALLCFSFNSVAQEENLLSAITIPLELKANANAVVRYNDLKVVIESQDKMTINHNSVVSIMNEKGNAYLQAVAGYDRYNKIKKIEAIVFDEYGNEVKKFKKRDFVDHSAVDGGTLYSDSRLLYMPYTPINYPYTVKFTYEIETPNTGGIPSWRPIMGYYVSSENSTYSVVDNAEIGIHFKEKNFDGFNIESNNSPYSIQYSLKNFKTIKPEDLSPSLNSIMPKVMVRADKFHFYGVSGVASNWVEFGDWIINSLLLGRNEVTEETKNEILNLVSSTDDVIEKSKMIYEYVQKNTRYISVQVGIGGVQPIPALEVDKLKYGDCKGLTNYTAALLEIAGVPSYYTVVEAGKEIIDFEEDFPSMEQGNHIILGIPNKKDIIWIDCTSQLHPFGFVGDFTDNRKVLAVAKGGSKIIETSKYINVDNHQLTNAKIVLQNNGSFSSQLTIKTKGIKYDNRFQLERQSDKDIKEFYKNVWSEINYLRIKNYKFNNNKDDVVFTENIEVEALNYATITGNKLIFQPNVLNRNTFIPRREKNRYFPIEIQRGYVDEDLSKIEIPEGHTVEFLPEDASISNAYGNYSVSYKQEDNIIIYSRKLSIKKGTYPNTEYDDYRDFRRKISKLDKSKIILNRTK